MTVPVLLLIFLALIVLRVPIALTMGIATLVSMLLGGWTRALYVIPQQMVEGIQSPTIISIAFFILAGNLMNKTGLTDKIFDFSVALIGHIRGGLAQVNVLASMIFAGISGAAIADCAGLGVVEIRAMEKRGYNRSFAAAVTLASSAVGPIIPPSIPAIIYAVTAGVSIGRLFLAGFLPGVLIGIFLMILNYILSYVKKEDFPSPEKRPTFPLLVKSFGRGIFALFAPVIIVGGIVSGIVTAREAGTLAVIYVFICSFIYNKPKEILKVLPEVLFETMITTVVIMFLLTTATSFGWLIALEKAPNFVAKVILSISNSKIVFLLLVNIFYLVLGMLIEAVPALLITVPILLPLATAFGIDPVHFGLVVIYGLVIGIATPPVGLGLYVITRVSSVKFEELVVAVAPFLIPMIIVLFIITYVPQVVLLIPDLLMGR